MARIRAEVYAGGEEREPPVSRAEQLMKTHPDISVMRKLTGGIRILQMLPDEWRWMWVDVEHEKDSDRQYPSVIVSGLNAPVYTHARYYGETHDEMLQAIGQHGVNTTVKVHMGNVEQVIPEVGYEERKPYPSDFSRQRIRSIEQYSHPIPARELIAAARTGLDMLKAFGEASPEQRYRIDYTFTGPPDPPGPGVHDPYVTPQIVDETRPDLDAYIGTASPVLAAGLQRMGISYAHIGTHAIYALNALNKVTDAMLPGEMPPAPKNSREPRRRTTTNVSALRKRTPRG